MDHVEKIEVRNFLGLPDMATIRMADPEGTHVAEPAVQDRRRDRDRARRHRRREPAPVFIGEIVAFEPEFTNAAAMICVRAYDKSHRLQRNRRSADVPGHDALGRRQEGRRRAGLQAGTIDSTATVHEFLQQSMESDLDFINRLAARRELRVRRRRRARRSCAGRRNGAGAGRRSSGARTSLSFKPRMTASQQHDTVKVTS